MEQAVLLPHVVVVGAGFGGLGAARAPVAVTLVDRHNHHLFQPLLYQVATAALSPGDIAWPVRAVFRRQRNVTVLMAEVSGIDPAARLVHVEGGPALPYNHLVLATGATHAYFGHEEWAPYAPGLKTVEDATRSRPRWADSTGSSSPRGWARTRRPSAPRSAAPALGSASNSTGPRTPRTGRASARQVAGLSVSVE